MPDAYTSNKLGLIEPAAGAYSGTWNDPLYANWQTIDAALGGTTSITLSSSNVTLTIPKFPANPNPPAVALSAQNLTIGLQGTLTADVTVFLPAGVGGMWIFYNGTSGNFSVTVKTTASGSIGVVIPQGYSSFLTSSGVNVGWADNGNIIANVNVPQGVPAGSIIPFAGVSAPSGYLFCDNSVVPQITYPALFAAISTTWNDGNEGAGNFRLPDLRNMFLRGSGTSPVGAYEADDFKSHTHTTYVSDPGHIHYLMSQNGVSFGYGVVAQSGVYQSLKNTEVGYTNIAVYNSWTGGNETRPVNKRVLYIIKT